MNGRLPRAIRRRERRIAAIKTWLYLAVLLLPVLTIAFFIFLQLSEDVLFAFRHTVPTTASHAQTRRF